MPSREVHHADGIEWLRGAALGPEHALVTSLPDVSELPAMDVPAWRSWFVDTVTLACSRVAPPAVAIFYQTDIKHGGRWIDKGYLVHRGAEAAGLSCLWHKIVCRAPAGRTTYGRPAYGHWLAFSAELELSTPASTPDVLPELGEMTWARAMPMSAAVETCRFLVQQTACRVVVDPFCGHGTILAVANEHGLDAIGVELSSKRVRKALALTLRPSPERGRAGPSAATARRPR